MVESFSNKELVEMRKHARNLILRGNFTGFNIVRSLDPLPEVYLSLRFLHDDLAQIEHIVTNSKLEEFKVLPRETAYLFDVAYSEKLGFEEEYGCAIFINEEGGEIPLSEVRNQKYSPLVISNELDLFIPLKSGTLEKVVNTVCSENLSGPNPWIHPVMILKSEFQVKDIPGFISEMKYACISKNKEEAYVLVENDKCAAVQKYVNKIPCVSDLSKKRKNVLVFYPSQVNEVFFDYVVKNARNFFQE